MTRRHTPTAFSRATLALVCALLLFAQQVGLSHAVWHATQQLPQQVQTFQEKGGSGSLPSLPHASKLCPLDAALGQVLGAGPVAGFAFDHSAAVAHTSSCVADHPASLHALAPRSRGPPPLL
jgi:hypothetical protein